MVCELDLHLKKRNKAASQLPAFLCLSSTRDLSPAFASSLRFSRTHIALLKGAAPKAGGSLVWAQRATFCLPATIFRPLRISLTLLSGGPVSPKFCPHWSDSLGLRGSLRIML